jgi:hypothetical protein
MDLAKSGAIRNYLAYFSAAVDRDNFHKLVFTVLPAGRADGLSTQASVDASLPQPIALV